MKPAHSLRLAPLALALALSGCGLFKTAGPPAEKTRAQAPETPSGTASSVASVRLITAQTPAVRAYRKTAAGHLYKVYAKRIYKGKIPPLVYAVVVVETDVDANGKVVDVFFSRTPGHAPEVAPMIARLIKDASPLPSPGKLGAHTYVDTWLWDKSGNFQIDSLTLGQRSR